MSRPLVVVCALAGRLFPQVETAVAEQHPGYLIHYSSPGDAYDYTRALDYFLHRPGPLVVVEGDVVPPEGAIPGLLDCPRWWCSHECWLGERYYSMSLGLVKFDTAALEQFPGWVEEGLRQRRTGALKPITDDLSVGLARALLSRGLEPHVHHPPALHLRYLNDPGLEARPPGYRERVERESRDRQPPDLRRPGPSREP